MEYDRLIVFKDEEYAYSDPWGKQITVRCLRVRAILRPLTDPTITRFVYTADDGYGRWEEYGYHIPHLGDVRHHTNRVDFLGSSWWRTQFADGHTLHDKGTIRRETKPLLDMWGQPTTKGRLFP